jgi:hypothetical protein
MAMCESRRGPGFETSRIVNTAAMPARADHPLAVKAVLMTIKKQAPISAGQRTIQSPLGQLPEDFVSREGAYDRRRNEGAHSAHKAEFAAALAQAHADWCHAGNDEVQQRRAAHLQLAALVRLAQVEGYVPSPHLLPLVVLSNALLDLNEGRQPKLLKHIEREGKRGNPGLLNFDAMKCAIACAAVDYLSGRDHGKIEDLTAEFGHIIKVDLGSWRKRFNARDYDHDPRVRSAYDENLSLFKQESVTLEMVRTTLKQSFGN